MADAAPTGPGAVIAPHRLPARPTAGGPRGDGEFPRAEQIGDAGHRDRRHPGGPAQRHQFGQLYGAFRERIGGMNAKMDEVGVAHHPVIPRPGFRIIKNKG